MLSITGRLCARIAATGAADLTPASLQRARQLFLDGLAVALAGTVHEAPPRVLAEHVKEMGGKPVATVLGFGFKTSPVQAAYVNGVSMHVLDFEPMWSPANHQLSTCLPAVLALAESRGADGLEVITALVKGIEMMGWLRQASGLYEARSITIHPPGAVGPIGAAVAAGHLLGLDADTLRHAVGIAASRCGSLLANAGTMTKSTHCGLACSLGLDAALLAARGFTANPDILEADRGYARGYFADDADLALLENFGSPFRVVDPGYALKMFPSQYGTHFIITAGMQLRAALPPDAKIDRIRLRAPVMPYIDRPRPDSGLAGKFSMQYAVSLGVLDGGARIESFSDKRRFSQDMVELLQKVEVEMREEIPGRFEEMYVEADAVLESGDVVSTRCDGPAGIWGGTPVSEEAHEAKLRDCFSAALDEGAVRSVLYKGRRLDELNEAEIRELIAGLA